MDAFLATMQQVLDYLHTIKITDLIDIAIISYLFYRIILFAKETRAGQVLRGIGLVIFLLWIANVFNLHILAYILSKAVELGFLALVVVFQPEIRHFLEKMGSGSLRLTNHNIGQPSSDLETAIDQTVEAYAAMSKDKVGALVVFAAWCFVRYARSYRYAPPAYPVSTRDVMRCLPGSVGIWACAVLLLAAGVGILFV